MGPFGREAAAECRVLAGQSRIHLPVKVERLELVLGILLAAGSTSQQEGEQ